MTDIAFQDNAILFHNGEIAFGNRCCCNCPRCTDITKLDELQVEIAGLTNSSCGECVSDINGVHILTIGRVFGGGGQQGLICNWGKLDPSLCSPGFGIELGVSIAGNFTGTVGIGGSGAIYFNSIDALDFDDCLNLDITIPHLTGSFSVCGNASGVTLRVTVP